MYKKLKNFQDKYKEDALLLANYLVVLNAFLLPISFTYSKIIFQIILILFLFSGNIKEKLIFALKNRIIQAILIFFFMHFIWLYSSDYLNLALWRIKELKYLLFIIVYAVVIEKRFQEKILNSFIFAVILSEAISFMMILNINIPFITITGVGDYVPFFLTYTQYVLLISIGLGLVLYKLLTHEVSKVKKIIYYIFFITSTINIFMLQSKLGYGLYFINVISTLFFISKDNIKKRTLVSVLFVLGMAYFLAFNFSSNFKQRIINIENEVSNAIYKDQYTGSTGVRIGIIVYSYPIIKEHFFFGIGNMNHIQAVATNIENASITQKEKDKIFAPFYTKPIQQLNTLHNEYIAYLTQFGIIGLILLLNIFYAMFKQKTDNPYLNLLKTLLIVNFIFYFAISHFFVIAPVMNIFALLAALTIPTLHKSHTIKK